MKIQNTAILSLMLMGSLLSCSNPNNQNNGMNNQQGNMPQNNQGYNQNVPPQNNNMPPPSGGVQMDFIKTFEGQINNKYDITLKITSNNGQISGVYFYKSVGKDLTVKGSLDNNGNINLTEYDHNGNMTGQFNGTMVNNNKIEGSWSKPNGSNSAPFYLIESNSSYAANQQQSQNANGNANSSQLYKDVEIFCKGRWEQYDPNQDLLISINYSMPRFENGYYVGESVKETNATPQYGALLIYRKYYIMPGKRFKTVITKYYSDNVEVPSEAGKVNESFYELYKDNNGNQALLFYKNASEKQSAVAYTLRNR